MYIQNTVLQNKFYAPSGDKKGLLKVKENILHLIEKQTRIDI